MRSYRRSRRSVLVGLTLLALTTSARAQSIEDARGAWFDADFERSRDRFLDVLARPELTAAEALDAHRYLAVLSLVLGDEAAARAHADATLALDASATPPEGAPPEASDLFRMARRRVGDHVATLTIDASTPLALATPTRVVARLEPAPAALFRSIRLRCGEEEVVGAPPSVAVSVVPLGPVTCTAEALTAGGAALAVVQRELAVTSREPTTSAPSVVDAPRRRRWIWPVVAAASALVVGGVVTGVVVHARREDDARFGGTTVIGW